MVQSKSNLLPQQMIQLMPKPSPPVKSSEPLSSAAAESNPVTSQELSVAQMMMTLAQASNKSSLTQGSTSQTPNATDGNSS